MLNTNNELDECKELLKVCLRQYTVPKTINSDDDFLLFINEVEDFNKSAND